MTSRENHRRPLRTAHLAALEPADIAGSERSRAVTLDAEAPDTGAVVRRLAFDALHDWDLHRLVDDVSLCLSELVGNAVHHAVPDGWQTAAVSGESSGGRKIAVTVRAWPTCLFLEVADEDSTPPMLPAGDLLAGDDPDMPSDALLADNGRGLLIIQSLSDAAWWAPREEGGKSVFCRFDLDDGTASTSPPLPY
ncbi:ATP-binding protein [Streptomyces sp. NBC_00370]|uniref:ATP-binding protein n=1 Tax=Streptomyces sp. NBC_00370 TaxID=2975728 RepID=UPI002E273DE7